MNKLTTNTPHLPKTTTKLALAIMTLFAPGLVMAQTPDAGSLLRDIEASQPGVIERLPEQRSLPPALPDTGQRITLKSVRFQGYEGMASEAELQAVIRDALGQELGFNGLQHQADRISDYLKNKGYFLAYAYLPQQDISQGELLIIIQPGRIEGGALQHRQDLTDQGINLSSERIFNTLNQSLKADENDIIRAKQMERGLLLVNDLSGISARSNLEKGAEPGTTRININLKSTPRYTANAWLDNYGNRYTGSWRANAMGNINNLSGRGDQLNLMANISTETLSEDLELKYARLGYSLPVGYSGLSANFGVSYMQYTLGKELKDAGLKGNAITANAQLRYPIIRSRQNNLYISGGYDYKTLDDKQDATNIKQREYNNLTLALNGDKLDQWQGGGLTNYSLSLTAGKLDRKGNAQDYADDQAGAQTHGDFSKANLTLARLQKLTDTTSLMMRLAAQYTQDNLDSSEEFTLGGPSGVRAYAGGEGAGDYGWQTTLEARYDLPGLVLGGNIQLQAFIDHGHITLHADQWDSFNAANVSLNAKDNFTLTGVGLGASLIQAQKYSLKASYAWKVNDDIYDRSLVDTDSEGQEVNGRFWLQAMAWF